MKYLNQSGSSLKNVLIFFLILYTNILSFQNNFKFSATNDTINKTQQIDSLRLQMTKSPWQAVLRSALIPGLGQYYNESYWKIPIIIGTFTYLGYQWKLNNDNFINYKNLFQNSTINNQTNYNYYKLREFYRDLRDLFAVYIGLAYLLNLIDAYVDSHLFDFNVNENSLLKIFIIEIKMKIW